MFIIKSNYYLYIQNTKSINLDRIKKNKKITFIYRNNAKQENYSEITKFRTKCKIKNFKFYIANDLKLVNLCGADGLYVSSYNNNKILKHTDHLIGSAHNFKEIYEKIKQGCKTIMLSRLFKTSYKNKNGYLGVIRFNLIRKNYSINLIPLGGINSGNLLKLNLVNSKGFSLLSEIKKKPAISNRLF